MFKARYVASETMMRFRRCQSAWRRRKWWISWSLSNRIGRVFILTAILGVIAVNSVVAREIAAPFLGVDKIEVSMHVDADQTMASFIDPSQFVERILEHLLYEFRDSRPDIIIKPGSMRYAPEAKDLDSGTLSIALTLTLRSEFEATKELPCCFGALTMRVDRDAFRRRPAAELIHSEDLYRVNWPPELLFLGHEKKAAEDRVFLSSVQLLEKVLTPLSTAPPNN